MNTKAPAKIPIEQDILAEGRQNRYIEIEYPELNNHIRECWKYISDLLKNFLTFQIILVSLVFLSGNIIRFEQFAVGAAPTRNTTQNEQSNNFTKSQLIPNKSTNDGDINIPRKFPIFALMVVGAIGAAGAALQNIRLFRNATSFIRRAAFLETSSPFLDDNRSQDLEKTSPANTLLRNKILSAGVFDLGWVLTFVYGITAALWGWAFIKLYY